MTSTVSIREVEKRGNKVIRSAPSPITSSAAQAKLSASARDVIANFLPKMSLVPMSFATALRSAIASGHLNSIPTQQQKKQREN